MVTLAFSCRPFNPKANGSFRLNEHFVKLEFVFRRFDLVIVLIFHNLSNLLVLSISAVFQGKKYIYIFLQIMTNHFCDIEIFPVLFLNHFITIITGSYMKYVYVWKKSFCLLRVFINLDLLRVGYVLVNPYIGIHIHRYFSIVLAFPSFECTYTCICIRKDFWHRPNGSS